MTVPLPHTAQDLLSRESVNVSITIGHDDVACPIASDSIDAHGDCWRVTLDDDCKDIHLRSLLDRELTDLDIASLLKAREVFFEGTRYSFNIDFEKDYSSREGIVFRESRLIARELGLRPITPGIFLELDSEQLQVVLTADKDGIQIGTYSTLTGERIVSGALIPQGKKWDIDEVIENYVDETEQFVTTYFELDDEDFRERILNFDKILDDMRIILRRIKKGLPPR